MSTVGLEPPNFSCSPFNVHREPLARRENFFAVLARICSGGSIRRIGDCAKFEIAAVVVVVVAVEAFHLDGDLLFHRLAFSRQRPFPGFPVRQNFVFVGKVFAADASVDFFLDLDDDGATDADVLIVAAGGLGVKHVVAVVDIFCGCVSKEMA